MHAAKPRRLVVTRFPASVPTGAFACLLLLDASACSSFRTLRKEVSLMEKTSTVSVQLQNADQYPEVYGAVVQWDRDHGEVLSYDATFSAVRGEEGMWRPASFPRDTGVGIYFLEPYDPVRVPVLFVYGIAGSPQDWRPFFSMLDRTKYQAWFYLYPTGRRLDESGTALNRGVEVLQAHLRFPRLHVVAHSMGGLVSRSFLIKNVLEDGNHYVTRFVSISTPWGGHEAAAMGVHFSPAVVPSWRDMVSGSDFQKATLSKPLRGYVDHLLVYGNHSSTSFVLPHENDGTVSVASQLAPAARADAVAVAGFDADHVGILSRPEVVQAVEAFLAGELR